MTALPKLAAPAARALAAASIHSLEEAARWRETDLAALHGIGPNALKTLKAALKSAGLAFRA